MKLANIAYIALVLWLLCVPAHGSTHFKWLIRCEPDGFTVYQVTDHFKWQWGAGSYRPVERIDIAERLVQAVVQESLTTQTPVPEPSTLLLLASGLVAVAIRRKR